MFQDPFNVLSKAWVLVVTSLAIIVRLLVLFASFIAEFFCKALYVLFQAIYNIFWHPLRKYPGPRHFAASPLPYVFASFSGRLARKFHELHAKYGPIVRTAPNELSFIDPEAWSIIYGRKNKSQKPFRKNYDSFNETRSQIRQSLYLANDEEHAHARKFLNHAFSPEALRTQEPLLQKHIQELMDSIDKYRQRGMVDLQKWYTWVAFDMIGDNSFGEPFNCVLDRSHRAWPLMLARARKAVTFISGVKNLMPSVPSFLVLSGRQKSLLQRTLLQSVVNSLDFDLGRVRSRIDSKPNRGDILSDLARRGDAKDSLDEKQVMANASLFILAGTQTVATLLCATTYLLTKNPDAMAKLIKEIRGHFPDESLLPLAKVNQMTYLTACIEEVLRIFPPVPEGLPRVTPREGETICGRWVPGGVI